MVTADAFLHAVFKKSGLTEMPKTQHCSTVRIYKWENQEARGRPGFQGEYAPVEQLIVSKNITYSEKLCFVLRTEEK